MAETAAKPETSSGSATVRLENIGPIEAGCFQVKPLTLFTGRNGAGKTITSTFLYIIQKSLWSTFRSNQRTIAAKLLGIERAKSNATTEAQNAELNTFLQGPVLQNELRNAFTDELSRAFTSHKNVIRHRKRRARFSVQHELGWSFECEITGAQTSTKLLVQPLSLAKPDKDPPLRSLAMQRSVGITLRDAFGGWQDRPIMIPAGRAGITDSYRYLAEQVLLERHGYKQGGPSGITRDFLAFLVGSGQPASIDEDLDEMVKFVSALFDPLLGGELRPTSDPEELFTFEVHGHRVDRNVMSSMVKELGPMVVLLQQGQARRSVLVVDEPECHLHPRAQIDLSRALVALVSNGARFVLSTHSPYLAQSLSNEWVERARSGGVGSLDMAVVTFVEASKGFAAKNVPYDPKYGFVFDDFADTANVVQDEFVGLFD